MLNVMTPEPLLWCLQPPSSSGHSSQQLGGAMKQKPRLGLWLGKLRRRTDALSVLEAAERWALMVAALSLLLPSPVLAVLTTCSLQLARGVYVQCRGQIGGDGQDGENGGVVPRLGGYAAQGRGDLCTCREGLAEVSH